MDRDRKVNEKKKKTRICIGEKLLDLLYPPRCPLCDQILTGKVRSFQKQPEDTANVPTENISEKPVLPHIENTEDADKE